MADRFVNSAAVGAGTGVDWANAYTTLAAALAVSTNADTIYVANTHNATQTTAKTLTCPTSPGLRILVVTPSGASGNSGLATGAIEAIGAGSVTLAIVGFAYIYGLSFYGATNASAAATVQFANATNAAASLYLENCDVRVRTTSTAAQVGVGIGPSKGTGILDSSVQFKGTTFRFGATTQGFFFGSVRARFQNMSLDAAGSIPTTLLQNKPGAGSCLIEASDLSGRSWANLVSAAWQSPFDVLLRNCELPSGAALTTGSYSGPGGVSIRMENCDSSDTQYNVALGSYSGTVVDESTIVRTGGGATSLRMDTSANTKFPYLTLTAEGARYNSVVGTAQTLTIEFIHDTGSVSGQGAGTSFAYTNAQLWVELQYQGTSGLPLALIDIDDRAANVLSTPADQPSSSATWTTTGMTTPVKGKMECTFTAQEAGYLLFKVCFAAPSKVVYVDLLGVTVA